MSSGQKIAISILLTVSLFAAFTVAAFAGLFPAVEARFYEPAKIAEIQNQLDNIAFTYDKYIETLAERFGLDDSSFIKHKEVASYIESSPSAENVRNRTNLAGNLFAETPGLSGIRLVDSNGVNIHFSTYRSDILRQTPGMIAYKNYADVLTPSGNEEEPYNKIFAVDSLTSDAEKYKISFDGRDGRIIFAFPFYDSYSAYRGTMFFYVNVQDFNRVLLSKNIITIGGTGVLVSDSSLLVSEADAEKEDTKKTVEDENFITEKSGFVFGIPSVGRRLFEKQILRKWQSGITSPEKIVSMDGVSSLNESSLRDGTIRDSSLRADTDSEGVSYWVLISSSKSGYGYIGGVYRDETFIMPYQVRTLLLISIFITLFLIIFLIFSMKQDDMIVIRSRILKFQFGVVNEYLKKKENIDWETVSKRIEGRKEAVSEEIIKSLGRRGLRNEKAVRELLEYSWKDIISAIQGHSSQSLKDSSSNAAAIQNTAEIKKMLEDILSGGTIKVQTIDSPKVPVQKPSPVTKSASDVEPVEELEDISDAEPVEELEEISDAEPVEDLEEISDAEPVEELEEIPDAESVDDESECADSESVATVDEADDVTALTDDIPLAKTIVDENVFAEKIDFGEPERKAFVNSDDEDELENFNVNSLDFSELDSLSESEKENGNTDVPKTKNSADSKKEEDVELSEFNVNQDTPDELKEKIGFGSISPQSQKVEENDVSFDIVPQNIDFAELDNLPTVKEILEKAQAQEKLEAENVSLEKNIEDENDESKETENIEDENIVEDLEDASELEVLDDDKNSKPFMLTSFAANNDGITELEDADNVIVEDESGVFQIKSDLHITGVVQNQSFKKLVDTVLNK